ncbi:MAG: type II/IV secretion system protein [Planctomycetes bacterium]|nr:type II/IV secretion system protein [Planctomycetota bacterium]
MSVQETHASHGGTESRPAASEEREAGRAAALFEARLRDVARAGEAAVPAIVAGVLEEAVRRGASDVHWEPLKDEVEVRLRVDGVLTPAARLDGRLRENLVARLKVLADLLTYRCDLPQEGRIRSEGTEAGRDLRLSTFPTVFGEKAVVRIFDASRAALPLDELGLPAPVLALLGRAVLERSQGMVLLTGPSGSGKTTTLYACLRMLAARWKGMKSLVTLEDPVELHVPGVTQTLIRPAAGLSFAAALRSVLRQDPEVLLVGEIRDPETARIATEASLTGHLVLSTVHSGTAIGVFARLLEMGVEPYLVCSSVSAVAAQRLVRVLCPSCAPGRATGCAACFGSGFRGRRVLAEAVDVDDGLRAAILRKAPLRELAAAAGRRTPTLAEAAREAVAAGVTTVEEVRRVLGEGAP